MSQLLLSLILVCVLSLPVLLYAANSVPLSLMLAKEFHQGADLSLYSVSEKFDGVRAVWHEGQLLTRSGRVILAPEWFTSALPNADIEGELWAGYGRFDEVSALIRQRSPRYSLWNGIEFKVFDVANTTMVYSERMAWLESVINTQQTPWLSVVERRQITEQTALDAYMAGVVDAGGEGLMLNLNNALYMPSRTAAILKYKPTWDAEAQIVGYVPGQGKFQGQMGSLKVRMADGREFKIGTGFTDRQRENPPPLYAWVTFAYSGLTSSGKPRFARFVRMYEPL